MFEQFHYCRNPTESLFGWTSGAEAAEVTNGAEGEGGPSSTDLAADDATAQEQTETAEVSPTQVACQNCSIVCPLSQVLSVHHSKVLF